MTKTPVLLGRALGPLALTTLATSFAVGCGLGEGSIEEVDPGSIPEAVTYVDHVAPRIHYYCAGCHSPDAATTQEGGGWDFSTYELVQFYYDVIQLQSRNQFMPPGSARKMTPRDLAILERWADLGFPETEEDLP